MRFEWDEEKNEKNKIKHGIDFETAALVFGDKNRIVKYDEEHSLFEDRYITIGNVCGTVVIVMVVYTEDDEITRIISARPADKREEEEYRHG